MKIGIVNGSPRKNGATGKLLREAERLIKSNSDCEVEYFDLSNYEMKLCIGCISCYKTGKCIIENDGIEQLGINIRACDGIIIGSPTFGSNVTPQLKNFMDRSHILLEQGLHRKPCVSLVTYEIADGSSALKILTKFLMISGGTIKSKLSFKTCYNLDPMQIASNRKLLKASTTKLIDAVKKRRGKTLSEWFIVNMVAVQILWKPIFIKNQNKYAGILEAWKKIGI